MSGDGSDDGFYKDGWLDCFPDLQEKVKSGRMSHYTASSRVLTMLSVRSIDCYKVASSTIDIVRQLRALWKLIPLWELGIREGKIDISGHTPYLCKEVRKAAKKLNDLADEWEGLGE